MVFSYVIMLEMHFQCYSFLLDATNIFVKGFVKGCDHGHMQSTKINYMLWPFSLVWLLYMQGGQQLLTSRSRVKLMIFSAYHVPMGTHQTNRITKQEYLLFYEKIFTILSEIHVLTANLISHSWDLIYSTVLCLTLFQ